MRRLFTIWNRGYKTQFVIATDATEALELSARSGHISRANMYRKFQDTTEQMLAQHKCLEKALDAGRSGVAIQVEGGWQIDGEIID